MHRLTTDKWSGTCRLASSSHLVCTWFSVDNLQAVILSIVCPEGIFILFHSLRMLQVGVSEMHWTIVVWGFFLFYLAWFYGVECWLSYIQHFFALSLCKNTLNNWKETFVLASYLPVRLETRESSFLASWESSGVDNYFWLYSFNCLLLYITLLLFQ